MPRQQKMRKGTKKLHRKQKKCANGTKNGPFCQNEIHKGLMGVKCYLLCHIMDGIKLLCARTQAKKAFTTCMLQSSYMITPESQRYTQSINDNLLLILLRNYKFKDIG